MKDVEEIFTCECTGHKWMIKNNGIIECCDCNTEYDLTELIWRYLVFIPKHFNENKDTYKIEMKEE